MRDTLANGRLAVPADPLAASDTWAIPKRWRVAAVSVGFVAAVGTIAWWVVDSSQRRLIEFETLTVAEVIARQASEARSVYAASAVAKLKEDGTGAHRDSASKPGYVPLPAQFFGQLSRRASERADGLYRFAPISKWNLGADHALRDDFQRWAWAQLEAQAPEAPAGPVQWRPVWRIEDVGGVRTLRYLRADPAVSDACVECHNRVEAEPATVARRRAAGVAPGKTWKRHELMGAVEVAIPMERSVALARDQSQTSLLLVVGVTLIALAALGAFLYVDYSRRNQMAGRLAHAARHDSLTGLPNRSAFDQRLGRALARQPFRGFLVLLLDLDNFKEINDTLGHQIGDRVLEQVGRRFARVLREDDMVARLGGDEFAFVIAGADRAQAEAVSQRIIGLLDREVAVGDYRLVVHGSIGIVQVADTTHDALEIMRCADVAMYAAKRGNGDFTVYDETIDDNKVSRLTFVKDMRAALRGNQFRLCYQPKVDLCRQRVVGAEALLRWTHPELGAVPPQEIVPVAERTGLVRPLTEWVLGEAARQCRQWERSVGRRLHVAVNLSVVNLEDPAFVDQVRACIDDTGISPDSLALEITETAMMHDPRKAFAALADLADIGSRLSVDDFGTGYCSLGYLHRMPVHELKLDRSFVMQLHRSERDCTIVRAAIELAHGLGLKIVAEGVENQETLVRLRELGCDIAQGYHIARPMEAARFGDWLRAPAFAQAGAGPQARAPQVSLVAG